jgi:hypothetical protein
MPYVLTLKYMGGNVYVVYLGEVRMSRIVLQQLLHHPGDRGRGDPLPKEGYLFSGAFSKGKNYI